MNEVYVSCPVCDCFFSYDASMVNPDGSILLTCPRCGNMFAIQEGPPIGLVNSPEYDVVAESADLGDDYDVVAESADLGDDEESGVDNTDEIPLER